MTRALPESVEALVEGIRREAGALSDYRLDEQLAIAVARRDVAAAHKFPLTAAAWQELALALDDVRRARVEVRREIEVLTGPPRDRPAGVARLLTAEESAAVLFEDELPQEPPC